MNNRALCWLACWSLLLLQACGGGDGDGDGQNVTPTVDSIETPVQTNDGWETASLAEVGIDAQPIIDAVNQIRRGTYNEIHGFVIVKDGRLVLEEYGNGRMFEYGPVPPVYSPDLILLPFCRAVG